MSPLAPGAEATLSYDDWAWLRRFLRGAGGQERSSKIYHAQAH